MNDEILNALDRSPAVDVAKERSTNSDPRIVTLADGRKARVHPISASLLDEVTSRIKDPDVPMWYDKDKEREIANPSDPRYIRDMEEAARKRAIAGVDAMVMFGVDLIEGIPDDNEWINKLKYMERKGLLDLSEYDLNDQFDLEFMYKRFVAVDGNILTRISEVSGIAPEAIEQAERSFPGNA